MTVKHLFSYCPSTLMMERMAGRWTLPVMALVSETPIRFNQLRRDLDGVSKKMLAQTLRMLERDGIVSRTATATVPVTVEYTLTPLGRTLIEAFAPLRRWSEDHFQTVVEAQRHFDAHREPWLDTITQQRPWTAQEPASEEKMTSVT